MHFYLRIKGGFKRGKCSIFMFSFKLLCLETLNLTWLLHLRFMLIIKFKLYENLEKFAVNFA